MHLSACSVCSDAREELEREHEIFTQYYEQTALEPASEMWEAIRSRLHAEPLSHKRDNPWLKWGALVWLSRPAVMRQTAFALSIIVLTVAVTTFVLKRGADKTPDQNKIATNTPITPGPLPPVFPVVIEPKPISPAPKIVAPPRPTPRLKPLTDEDVLNRQIARTEREYQNAIRLLDQAIVKRKEELDPGVIKQYQASLALIDGSIAASRRVLRDHPTDLAARQFLLAAYARKVDLMQDIAMR